MLSSWALSVAILASIGLTDLAVSQDVISDTYFYGQSPAVYPSPIGSGTGDWATAYSKAAALVAQMTLDEKSNLTYGISSTTNGCSGNIPPITRLGFPGLCLQDAGNGVRGTDFVNGYPSGLHAGASWNKELVHQRGRALGGEFKVKGVNVALGPVIGPLGRIAEGGRNWEGFSNDPYLTGSLAAETIRGIQARGVMTSTKHYVGNEQETNRNPSKNKAGEKIAESISSNIDDKTFHELYLWPFADAVHAGTANVMCSYNRLNNSYACANSKSLNGILKTELGFQGFVVSDWFAQHAGVATALSGLDMVMPDSEGYWGSNLTTAITNGTIPESRLTDMATRIIASWYKLGQDSTNTPIPGVGMPFDLSVPHKIVDARDPASKSVLFDGAVEGHVLVKNDRGALPLKSPKLLSVFGYDAKAPDTMDIGSGFSSWVLGFESGDVSAVLPGFTGLPNPYVFSQIAANGTIISGGGSGANTPPYISSPTEALSTRAYADGTALFWDFVNFEPTVYGESDACLVFINAFASEGVDRTGTHDSASDGLINSVADQCNNTIVVIHNAGPRLVDQFVEHENVTAIIFAHLPGQDSGRALVSLLYGDSTFSGKLPYSVPKNESAWGNLLSPAQPTVPYMAFPQSDFSEGVYIDYRAFDAKNITPRYEFGYGLSYTTFSYSNLKISRLSHAKIQTYPSGPILEGGHTDLWDVLYTITADITNSGSIDGAEVAQLYIGIPGGPVKQLRGYSKVAIEHGKTVTVEFDVLRRDLSEWDVVAQNWKFQSGSYGVWVGASSRILPLQGVLTV